MAATRAIHASSAATQMMAVSRETRNNSMVAPIGNARAQAYALLGTASAVSKNNGKPSTFARNADVISKRAM